MLQNTLPLNISPYVQLSTRMMRILIALSLFMLIQFVNLDGFLRHLSIDLGNGKCLWTPPSYDPPNGTFFQL